MNFCIAAPDFNQVSETFIRDHVRNIAPGSTILLSLAGRDLDLLSYPALAEINSRPIAKSLRQRVTNAAGFRWQRYVDPSLPKKNSRRVCEFLKKYAPKAVLAEYGPTGCLLTRVCNKAGVPLYVHFHGYDASRLLSDARQVRHYRRLFHHARGVIVPSRFLFNNLAKIGCPTDKLHISPYGIDVRRFKNIERVNNQRVVAVGRLVEKKAPHLTIKSFAKIARRFPEAHLDIVGDGPLMGRCRSLIEEFGLGERICMHGAQQAAFVTKVLENSSLFVQHSLRAEDGDTEGLPVSILEAMGAGLPVVATRHAGIPEAVVDDVTGRLVDEHDVDSMSSAMADLLDDPAAAARMGAAGRQRVVSDFSLDLAHNRLRAIMGLSSGDGR